MASATTGVTAMTPDDGDRIRVPTIAITAPQHEQIIGGRSWRGVWIGLQRVTDCVVGLQFMREAAPA